MKYILNAKEVREGEQYTMQNEPIASIDLMERAGATLTDQLLLDINLSQFKNVWVFCGPGNNGGDGLVVARLLGQLGSVKVSVILATEEGNTTPDFETNLARIKEDEELEVTLYEGITQLPEISDETLIIDALFGIGLSRELKGYFADIANFINRQEAFVVSVDAPSGLFIDCPIPLNAVCVRATLTYTFQWQKWAYLSPENEAICGEVRILDIGMCLPPEKDTRILPQFIEKEDISRLYHTLYKPQKFAHKGSNGHALLLAGSGKMPGAAILCATAAMRSGIGKLTIHTTENTAQALTVRLPEVIINQDINKDNISMCHWEDFSGITAIAMGPGIGNSGSTGYLLRDLLSDVRRPIVLDADALNLLAQNKTLLGFLPSHTILTPHFKEFERLAGICGNHFERIEKLKAFAIQYNIIVVLKGANSVIALPDGKIFVNDSGNPGMATAGSGDVLTGIILGLLGRGFSPVHAAIIGTHLHGMAGDCALEQESVESLLASDICQYIGAAFRKL